MLLSTAIRTAVTAMGIALVSLGLGKHAEAQPISPSPGDETLPGPAAGVAHEAWLSAMQQWRDEQRHRYRSIPSAYDDPALAWCRRAFVQPQMMVEDRYFFDPASGKYTVDRYLDDLQTRYGGIDAVLIWAVYPNIGIDARSQHDLLRDLPGGLDGVRQMVADFHRRGVRVLFPVMPWDAGTHPDPKPLHQAAARDMKTIDADGLNGDTMPGLGRPFWDAALANDHPLALQPELGFSDPAMLNWNVMSWGYWPTPETPAVSLYKWLEPRHMVNVCQRWAKDRTDQLQAAFFNGVGYESWENIWGIWNGITPRDAEALRRIRTIQCNLADLWSSPDWQPHIPTLRPGVYASKFPGPGRTVWTLINRDDRLATGELLTHPEQPKARYFDLWNGLELHPRTAGGQSMLSLSIEPRGYGAILAVDQSVPLPDDVQTLIAHTAAFGQKKLADFSAEWKPLPQQLVPIAPTPPPDAPPTGMVRIPAGTFLFKVSGVMIEGWASPQDDDAGVDVQYPWETVARRRHDTTLKVNSFYIDQHLVTNAQFKRFIDSAHYQPADAHHFLHDWTAGAFAPGTDNLPVTWVSIEDARAYAAWAGKRLPHEWEWQYAAQGTDERSYPWGRDERHNAIPPTNDSPTPPPLPPVGSYPAGQSPFGVMDLAGFVWQWTDEYHDDHTRAAILRGGSCYRPAGSGWYFPPNTKLQEHGKYLLMAPCKDRSAFIGFRCAADATTVTSTLPKPN